MLTRQKKSGFRANVSRFKKTISRWPGLLSPGKRALEKGRANERRALYLVDLLHLHGYIPHLACEAPYLTIENGTLDQRGIDIVIPTDIEDIHLQVKSSNASKYAFLRKRRRRQRSYIPVVVVNDDLNDVQIMKQIVKICWRQYYIQQEKMGRVY